MLLKSFMRRELDGWESDLSQTWQSFLGPVDLGFEAMGDMPMIGGPPNLRPKRESLGSGTGYIFKAFDGIEPDKVRVLVIGQDPYPKAGQATGRAFEDGLFVAWDGKVADSLKRLRRAALDLRLPTERILSAKATPWKKLQRLMTARVNDPGEPVPAWFDDLEQQGVMFVNAAMTLTEFGRPTCPAQRAHVRLWRPLICRLARRLAARPDREIVFLLLGGFAKDVFARTGVTLRPRGQESGGPVVDTVEHWHPTYGKFLEANPLAEVNEKLGNEEIRW
jgi:uracil-DNA glycosylase